MKPTRNAPATHLQPVKNPNGTHAFQKLSNDRQRAELAKGFLDFEQRLVEAGLIQKLGKPA